MVADTRAATMLDDDALDLVADQLTRIAQLVSDHDRIAELDLNPVIVSEDGAGSSTRGSNSPPGARRAGDATLE